MKYFTKKKDFDLGYWRRFYMLSGREMAEVLDVDYSYLCRLENEKYTASAEMAKKIFEGLEKLATKKKTGGLKPNYKTLISELA